MKIGQDVKISEEKRLQLIEQIVREHTGNERRQARAERSKELEQNLGCGFLLLLVLIPLIYWLNPADLPHTLAESWMTGDSFEETKSRRMKTKLLSTALCYVSEGCTITQEELEDALSHIVKYPELLEDPTIAKMSR